DSCPRTPAESTHAMKIPKTTIEARRFMLPPRDILSRDAAQGNEERAPPRDLRTSSLTRNSLSVCATLRFNRGFASERDPEPRRSPMQIAPFEMERWQSVWENQVELNVSESGVDPLSLRE